MCFFFRYIKIDGVLKNFERACGCVYRYLSQNEWEVVYKGYEFIESSLFASIILFSGLCSQWRPQQCCALSLLNTLEGCAACAGISACLLFAALLLFRCRCAWVAWRCVYAVLLYWLMYTMCRAHLSCVSVWGAGGISLLLFRAVTKHEVQVTAPAPSPDGVGRLYMYGQVAGRLEQMLIRSAKAQQPCGVVVAVYGPWGSGKSHFVQSLLSQIRKRNDIQLVDCGTVNLWNCETAEQAWSQTEQALCSACGIETPRAKSLFLQWLPVVISALCKENKAIRDLVRPGRYTGTASSRRHVFSDALEKQNRYAVVVFEDIERMRGDVFRRLLPLLQRLHAMPRLLVLCSIAFDELSHRRDQNMSGMELQGYFDKLFDYSYYMPPLLQENARAYFAEYVRTHYAEECPHLMALAESCTWDFDTVRQIERIADYLAGAEQQYFGNGRVKEIEIPTYFAVMVIRLLFYPVAQEMRERNWSHRHEAQWGARQSGEKAEFASLFPLLHQERGYSRLLDSLLTFLDDCNHSTIGKALEMHYVYYHLLSPGDCRQCLAVHVQNMDSSAEELVRICFSDRASAVEVPSLVRSLFVYLFEHACADSAATECLITLIQKDMERGTIHRRYYMKDAETLHSLLWSVLCRDEEPEYDAAPWKDWLKHNFFPCFTFEEWEEWMASFFPICRHVWDNGLDCVNVDEDNWENVMKKRCLEPYLPRMCECFGKQWAQMVLTHPEKSKYGFFEEMFSGDMPEGSLASFLNAVRKEMSSHTPEENLMALEHFVRLQENKYRPYAISQALWNMVIQRLAAFALFGIPRQERERILQVVLKRFREEWIEFIFQFSVSDDEIKLSSEDWDVRELARGVEQYLARSKKDRDSA